MFCSKCGNEVPEGVKFCVKCGTPVQGAVSAPQSVPPQQYQPPPAQYEPPAVKKTSGVSKTAVLLLNIFGLNWLSRFITGHIATGVLVLLLDIISIFTTVIIIGWAGIAAGVIIWIVDIVTVCTNKWKTGDGEYITKW